MSAKLGLLVAAFLFGSAAAPQSGFDPRTYKGAIAGPPTELLVLGTPHLSSFPNTFDRATLAPLLDRLAGWNPQIITIEAISGPECEYLVRYKARYGSVDNYCWDRTPAFKATGLDVVAATAELDRLLASWPAAPTAAQRRRLAALFLAAGDQASALVQWLRLPPAERREGDGLDTALVTALNSWQTRRNESFSIGAALAARLGLERVYPIDDQRGDTPIADEAAYGAAVQRAWDNPVAKKRAAEEAALQKDIGSGESLLRLYRHYNQPSQQRVVFDSDFGAALKEQSPQHYGRLYVASWEARNLRMIANISAAAAARPGGRVLTIVGASHKGYFEAYLGMMHDIRLADAETVLR